MPIFFQSCKAGGAYLNIFATSKSMSFGKVDFLLLFFFALRTFSQTQAQLIQISFKSAKILSEPPPRKMRFKSAQTGLFCSMM